MASAMVPPPAFDRTSRIGLIGVGTMGSGMAARLLDQRWRLAFYARREEVGIDLVHAGASRATSLHALGSECGLVLLCLPDADIVEEVLFGCADQLVTGLRPGSCIVDTSSTSATSARHLALRLAHHQCHYIDAPVSGGQLAAKEGRLTCMAGGEPSVLDACREVLEAFCAVVTHVGPVGSGQAVKGCNQVAVAVALLGVAEAIALAEAQNLDPLLVREILLAGTARSTVLERHAQKIIRRDVTPGFRAELMRKDLRLALKAVQELNVNMPGTRLVEYLLDCLCTQGLDEWDWSAIAQAAQWRAMKVGADPGSSDVHVRASDQTPDNDHPE